jgi:hairy-and-enhancer-of-split protein
MAVDAAAVMMKRAYWGIDSGIDSGSSPELSSTTNTTGSLLLEEQPVSRTHQYRKVMKPLLERKRRARINHCLDELKDLMVGALQTEGENVSKLEKADILELTVRHLHKLKQRNALGLTPQATYAGKFRAGYAHCAQEVSRFMTSVPDMGSHVSARLLAHLGGCLQALEMLPPSAISVSPASDDDMHPLTSPPLASALASPLLDCVSSTALDLSRKRTSSTSDSDDAEHADSTTAPSGKRLKRADSDDRSWRPW